MTAFHSASRYLRPALFLDYGADAVDAETAACEVCERGMRFKSQWKFDQGALLHIAFAFEDGVTRRIEAEGFVVECVTVAQREYQTTLAFLETPQELRASLGKFSTRLEFSPRETSPPELGRRR
jgi:hypothetical protein